MIFGYARISTHEQKTDVQIDALKIAGCEKIFADVISGSKSDRPQLTKLREQLRPGDTIIVLRLDRLSRSLGDLIEWIKGFEEAGVNFQSLHEKLDTSSAGGKLIFHIFGAIAEFERNLIRERTTAGLSAARARGRVGGRPEKLNDSKKKIALRLYNEEGTSIKEICETLNISKSTLFRLLKKQ